MQKRIKETGLVLILSALVGCSGAYKDIGKGIAQSIRGKSPAVKIQDPEQAFMLKETALSWIRQGKYYDALELLYQQGEHEETEKMYYILLDQGHGSLANKIYVDLKETGYELRPWREVINEINASGQYNFENGFLKGAIER